MPSNQYHPGFEYTREREREIERERLLLHDDYIGGDGVDDRFRYDSNYQCDFSIVDEHRSWAPKVIHDDEKRRFMLVGDNSNHFSERGLFRDYSPNMWTQDAYNDRNIAKSKLSLDVKMEKGNNSGYGSSKSMLKFPSDTTTSRGDRFIGRMRESKQKFINRSAMKKPIQKKSALLRIQLGNNGDTSRNKNRPRDSKDYFDQISSSSGVSATLTGREENNRYVRSDPRIVETREVSPVELDVSFKSNSLVAKAIATPSTPTGCSSRNLTNVISKSKKVNLFCSPLTKLTEDLYTTNCFTRRNDPSSCLGKSLNIGSASGSSSHVVKRDSDDIHGEASPTSSPDVKASGSFANSGGSPYSQRTKKIRKITALPTLEPFQQSVEVHALLSKFKVDNSRLEESKHLGLSDAFSDVPSENYTSKSPSSNNALVNIEYKSVEGMILEKDETDFGFGRPYALNCFEKTGDSTVSSISAGTISSNSSAFYNQVETVTEEIPVQAYKSDKKYDSTMLCLEGRPAHSSFEKLFDSSKYASQNELVSLENVPARGSQVVEVSVKDYMESSQPSTKEMKSPLHHPCQPAAINDCSHICDFGCTDTYSDPECDLKDDTHNSVILSDAGFKEVPVSQTMLLKGTKPCENVPNVCGSRNSNTACRENGNVSSSGLLCNKSISALQDDLESDCPQTIVDQLAAPLQKGVGKESEEAIFSIDLLEVYSPTSGRKRKSTNIQLFSSGSSAGNLPVTTGSCVSIITGGNCCSDNVSHDKESANLDKNNGTSSGASLACDPVSVSLPYILDDDANEVSPRYRKKSKINPGNDMGDTSLSVSDESCAYWRKGGFEGLTGLGFANIPSLLASAGRLIQDTTSGSSFKALANTNGSFKEHQEIDLCTSYPCANPEDSSAASKTKNQLGNMAIVSLANVEPPTDMVDLRDGSVSVVINLESFSPHPPYFSNRASSVDELITSTNDQSPMYPENVSVSDMGDCKTSGTYSSCGMVHQNDKTLNIERLSVSDSEVDKIVDQEAAGSPQIYSKTASTQPQGIGKVNHSISSVWIKSNSVGNHIVVVGPQVCPIAPARNTSAARKSFSLNHISKPRTWRRTNNISGSTITDPITHSIVPPWTSQKKGERVHNTYVRKGHSLVRKSSHISSSSKCFYSSTSTVTGVNSSVDNLTKVKELDPIDSHTTETSEATARHNATDKRPRMPSIWSGSKFLSSSVLNLNGDASLPGLDLSDNVAPVFSRNSLELTANIDNLNSKDAVKSSGALTCQTGSVKKFEGKNVVAEEDSEQKIMYIKHRGNQLVASMGNSGTAVPCGRKMRASSPNGYYKRRKNQLVRKSQENHVAVEGEQVKLSGHGQPKLNSPVWRLYDTESSKPDTASVCSFRAWHRFPWKRATYLRHIISTPSGSCLSLLSQKLLSRSRSTVYTRSINGFSLQRSKVGGSNLKWSKSTERKLKKELTLAVAASVRSRKERKMDPSAVLSRKNLVSRERIFRVGSQRYKMDPTRKTLHRITHEEDQLQSVPLVCDNGKKSYVPRKLFFGNDEYVRIGNGNKLVRDPKKRTRTLASEKVRWSLHTARLRLAKKKKYCQFFTRFGHCNKDDGKCAYIHDPSKIAVCTKFLNGSCSNKNCKLTHEVIPERMPDCSYFLQGLCSNKSCPYRHVHVHPSSSICNGFLKGYCACGNECRKKHTYVCPIFEATGECPQGSECKLHHPKKRNQMKKHLKAHRRYFVPGHIECTISKILSERCKDDILYEDGRTADYISLTVNDIEEVERTVGLINEQASDSDPSEAQVSALEDSIRPIRLISKTIQTSANVSSPTAVHTGCLKM